ncbi:MAG: Uma2 family endonuclease [Myxococcota bacterium]|nr:Uma2 family endonuclease [Myxococcota bacterium]
MSGPASPLRMTAAEYLAWEREQPEKHNPSVVVEVLSPSTERYDRGEKWRAYQRLGSLRDYLLVSQAEARVEHYQRTDGGWRYRALGEGERVELTGGSFLVDDLYRGAFDYPGDEPPETPDPDA